MSQVLPSAEPPTEERWAALGSVLLATLYLWILAWLLVAVVVPAVGFGWTPVVITSGSMEPLIRPGDVVLTSEPPLKDLAPGTVITFEDPARQGSLTTHRVVSVQDDGAYRTRGDANRAADSTPVPPEAVVGVGRLLVPMIGLPLLWLSGGLLLFVIWLGVTVAATAVAVHRDDGEHRETPPTSGTPASGARRTPVRPRRVPVVRPALGAAMRRLRPRNAQRAILAFSRRVMGAWLRRVLPAARPVAGRVRAWLPVAIVATAGGVVARTPLTITIAIGLGVLVLVLDPRGPELRIGRWHRTTVHTAQMVMAVLPTALVGRFAVALVVVGLVSGTNLGRSAAVFSGATSTTGSSFAASASFPVDPPPGTTTFWLQTSPEGQDTASQARLPFATVEPTQATLFNYDTDRDAASGLLVAKGASGPAETDLVKVQRWIYPVADGQNITDPDVVFWSATKDFSPGVNGLVAWHLRDCAAGGGGCVDIATATVSRSDWQQGSGTWVRDTADFGSLAYTFGTGRELQAVATVDASSGDDHWFAYGTVGQPSRLEFTAVSPPPPPPPPPGPDTTTFWLQTNPEGANAPRQATLPFATTAPTETVLYDYDGDGQPGLLIKRKGTGPDEGDPTKVQTWVQPITADLTVNGARMVFHSAIKDFVDGKGQTVRWHLRDCAAGGGSCTDLGMATLSRANWQSGSTTWVEDTATWSGLSHVFAAGRELRVSVTVEDLTPGAEHWFAYGTAGQPSRIELTSPTAGSCPGTGSATVIASADTYVLQDAPTTNFSTQTEVLVRSTVGGNGRTLLTFALPALPAGCSVTSATLTMNTVTAKAGRPYQVVRTDTAVTPGTVTWATQPAATGAVGTGLSTGNGPTPLGATAPVQELYTLGNTGLVVRDAVEGDGGTSTNKFDSLEGTTDTTKQPRLTIVWGP